MLLLKPGFLRKQDLDDAALWDDTGLHPRSSGWLGETRQGEERQRGRDEDKGDVRGETAGPHITNTAGPRRGSAPGHAVTPGSREGPLATAEVSAGTGTPV